MSNKKIEKHQAALKQCRACPDMVPPSVVCRPITSRVLLIGQAPGVKEPELQRPFAWTAGKTLFKWFASIGLEEEAFRDKVYMAAVCRCFPGKNPKGGDRVPNREEIDTCSRWLLAEFEILQPELIIPVGKLAMQQYLSFDKLTEVVGQLHRVEIAGREVDMIPLPHPSGASTWHRMSPGKELLEDALALVATHPEWQRLLR